MSHRPTPRPRTALVLFARPPESERKRLGLGVTADRLVLRGLLARALATLAEASHAAAATFIVTDGELDPGALRGVERLAQRGSSFEERLRHAIEDVAARGFARLVIVGSDTPAMRASDVLAALAAPAGSVTLGPAADGGVYLLGLDAVDAGLLAGLPWCTGALLGALTARARQSGHPLQLLGVRRDVDDARDVERLRELLERLCRELVGLSPFEPGRVAAPLERAERPAHHPHARTWRGRGPPTARLPL